MDTSVTPGTNQHPPQNGGEPAKYIRTFAGDMKTVQEHGTPDLVPFVKASAPQATLPPPPPVGAPAEPVSPAPPAPPAAHAPVTNDLKTYAGDFSERMKETHATTATVLAAEQDAAPPSRGPSGRVSSRGNLLYVIAGLVLLIAGAVGAYLAYARYTSVSAPVPVVSPISAPIFVDDREEVSGTGGALVQAINQSVARSLTPNAVRLLHASTTAEQSVFSMLTVAAPDILLRNIRSSGSMAGVVNVAGTQSPFFILSVTEYGITFSSMLSWETDMPRALADLFPAFPESVPVVAPQATSTNATTSESGQANSPQAASTTDVVPSAASVAAGFHDETAVNHDVRVYRDSAGREVLLYGYWNPTTLVIARNASAFGEIIERLATSRTTP